MTCDRCKCQCKPDIISFWWMSENFTFVRLKGKNLKDILNHAEKCRKEHPYGMLCAPTLLNDGKDLYRIGESIHDNDKYSENVKKWIEAIEKDPFALELIAQGKIAK